MTEAEIAHSSMNELRELPDDFWEETVPVLPAAKVPLQQTGDWQFWWHCSPDRRGVAVLVGVLWVAGVIKLLRL